MDLLTFDTFDVAICIEIVGAVGVPIDSNLRRDFLEEFVPCMFLSGMIVIGMGIL